MHSVPRYHYISPLRQWRRGALITAHHLVKNSSSLYHYISSLRRRGRGALTATRHFVNDSFNSISACLAVITSATAELHMYTTCTLLQLVTAKKHSSSYDRRRFTAIWSPQKEVHHMPKKNKRSQEAPAMKSILDRSSNELFQQGTVLAKQFQERTKELMAEKILLEGFSLVYKEQPFAVQRQHPTNFKTPDTWEQL